LTQTSIHATTLQKLGDVNEYRLYVDNRPLGQLTHSFRIISRKKKCLISEKCGQRENEKGNFLTTPT